MDPFETTFCGFAVVRNPLHDVESALVKVIIDQLSEQRTKEYKEKTKEPLTFKVDLSGFEPENIKLKTVGLKLIVEAQTEESNDKEGCQSYSVKKYHQTITLPDDVKPEDVTSSLTNEGVLRIAAPATSLPVFRTRKRNQNHNGRRTTGTDIQRQRCTKYTKKSKRLADLTFI